MPALCPEGWDDHYSMEKVRTLLLGAVTVMLRFD